MPSISIVIPTYNREDLLRQTLGSLAQISIPQATRVELVVVANACTDGTVAAARECFAMLPFSARVVEEPEPGLNAARNRAVAESTCEVVAMLDDDVLVDRRWLEGIADVLYSQPADIIAGAIELWWDAVPEPAWLSPKTAALLSGLNLGDRVMERFGAADVVGANFAFKRSVYAAVGPFRPELDRRGSSLLGGGESEWVGRALQAGFRLFYAPNAKLQHWVAPKRIQPAYLDGVAFSLGLGFILKKPAFGFAQAARAVAGYGYLSIKGRALELVSRVRRDQRGIYDARVERMIGDGGLIGSIRRLRGKPVQGSPA